MKKSMILLGMLSIGYTYAQEGNVGINTEEPKATLHIQPSAENLTKTTNEGIIAPKLTKARIAGIADANLTEGTLVYATDATYAGTNGKVSKITEKGYYFYNGTEWVKVQYNDTNTSLWVERDGNKVNLESSLLNQKVFYTSNGYRKIPKDKTTKELYNYTTNTLYQSNIDIAGNLNIDFSTTKGIEPLKEGEFYINTINQNSAEIDELKNNNGSNTHVVLSENNLTIPSNYPLGFHLIRAGVFEASKLNARNTREIVGLMGRALDAGAGDVRSMIGVSGRVFVQKPSGTLSNVIGSTGRLDILEHNKANISTLSGHRTSFTILGSGNIQNMIAYSPEISTSEKFTGTVSNYYDYYAGEYPQGLNVANGFGIYIRGANKKNYLQGNLGLGTTTPSEKLEVVGKIKTSSLAQTGAGDRVVYADENGVLKTGGSIASNNGVQNETGMTCTAANAGKINYTTIQKDGKDVGVFGFCMQKGTDYVWAYMLGGSNIYGTSANGAAFGQGL